MLQPYTKAQGLARVFFMIFPAEPFVASFMTLVARFPKIPQVPLDKAFFGVYVCSVY